MRADTELNIITPDQTDQSRENTKTESQFSSVYYINNNFIYMHLSKQSHSDSRILNNARFYINIHSVFLEKLMKLLKGSEKKLQTKVNY